MKESRAQIAVVGAGIVGLAVAQVAIRRGMSVVLFERNAFAVGASVRNFGLVWPIGQPSGPTHDLALRSREIWLECLKAAGLYHDSSGSLVLAYEPDEEALLKEYLENLGAETYGRKWVEPSDVSRLSASAVVDGLRGGMFSPTEVTIDPRGAIRAMPNWLQGQGDIELRFGTHVRSVSETRVETATELWRVDHAFVCGGQDFESLFPEVFAGSGLIRVKLQMMRTKPQPNDWRLGPALCGGLTMAHYASFAKCPTLPQLRERLSAAFSFERENGIHLLVSQTPSGELTLGDSHHTVSSVEPFDREDINEAICHGIQRFIKIPNMEITERWHGVYAKCPDGPWFIDKPMPGVTIVNGLGGGGVTLSFGLAEKLIGEI